MLILCTTKGCTGHLGNGRGPQVVRRPQHATIDSDELQCARELVHVLFDESKRDVRRVLLYYTTTIH